MSCSSSVTSSCVPARIPVIVFVPCEMTYLCQTPSAPGGAVALEMESTLKGSSRNVSVGASFANACSAGCRRPCTSREARAADECLEAPWTAAVAPGLVLGLVDLERAPAHVLTIEVLDGACCILTRHLDEAEAARPTGFPVVDQGD